MTDFVGALRAKVLFANIESNFAKASNIDGLSDENRALLRRLSLYLYQSEDDFIGKVFSLQPDQLGKLLNAHRKEFEEAFNIRPMRLDVDEQN